MTDPIVATTSSLLDRIVSVLFAISVIAWMFYVPAQPERLMSYIPDRAQAVIRVHDPVEQLGVLAEHPLIRRAEQEKVFDAGPLRSFLSDESMVTWLGRVVGDDLVVAHEPPIYGAGGRQEGWMVGAWIGGYGTAAIWGLTFSSEFDMAPEPFGAGHVLYGLKERRAGYDVAVTVYYGLLLAYVSKQDAAEGLKRMLARADFYPERPSVVELSPDSSGGEIEFWFDRARYQRFGRRYSPDYMAGEIDFSPKGRLAVTADARWGLNGLVEFSADSKALVALGGTLGDRMDAIYLGGQNSLKRIFDGPAGPSWAQIVVNQINALVGEDRLAFVGMMSGGGLSGRVGLMGTAGGERRLRELAVPTFLGGVYVGELSASDTEVVVNRVIDLLNARYSLGLVPRREMFEGHSVTIFDPTTDNGYARQHPEYRVALVVKDGWLIVCAHVQPLRGLLSTEDAAVPAWIPGGQDAALKASLWFRTHDVKPFRDILACMRMLGVGRMSSDDHAMIKGLLNSFQNYESIRADVIGGELTDRLRIVLE